MKSIYFGTVASFYDAEEVVSRGATYRRSRESDDLESSMNMLKQHLSGYFSSASAMSIDHVSVGNATVGKTSKQELLDNFFL